MSPSPLDLAAVFLTLIAALAWVNRRWLDLPPSVMMLGAGLAGALGLAGLDRMAPGAGLMTAAEGLVRSVDFSKTVLRFMLAYLLFAGALHVETDALKRRAGTAAVLATAGVAVSAAVTGGGLWLCARGLGAPLSAGWALVFGVAVAPTDPVGVLAILKRSSLRPDLRALIEGEALFNDGVGVVLFGAAAAFAAGAGSDSAGGLIVRAAVEAGGGGALGLIAGLVAIAAMRRIDDYVTEILITLALATGVYAGAQALGLSGPIAAVCAGLALGRHAAGERMRAETRRYVQGFWAAVDEAFNGALFLLVGLEMLSVRFDRSAAMLALCAAPLALLGRLASLAGPAALLARAPDPLPPRVIAVLAWAGIRGGLSIAMALSLPPSPARALIVSTTYAVAVSSILVQSLTLEPLVRRLGFGRAR